MDKLRTAWSNFLISEKGFSILTAEAYTSDLNYFCKFITQHYSTKCDINLLEALTIQDFRAWLAYRKKEAFAFSSTNRAIAAVKNYFRYLIRYYNFSNKSIFNLKSPKQPSPLPKALNEQQTKALLELEDETWIAARDHALIYLLYGCGLRISEALALTVKDLSKNLLVVKGKGNKERLVPILPIITDKIKEYLALCPYTLNDSIFVGKQGKPLDPGVFQRKIRKLRLELNLPTSTTPHAFRHSFATHILTHGGDLKSIQELLGHKDLTTTQKYTKVDARHLLDVYNKTHPFGK